MWRRGARALLWYTMHGKSLSAVECCDMTVGLPIQDSIPASIGVRCRADLKIHPIDDEGLIYDPLTADTHRLNPTAFFIWQQFDRCVQVDEIVRLVTEAYEVKLTDAKIHVERLLREFHERGLISSTDPAFPSVQSNC